ncbi:ABC transporter substrate-binding protein [Pseudoalteromonas sp. PS5]|nr:ABC transporter substrate-binding protein [Pseudoalteromonas sp. PS5]
MRVFFFLFAVFVCTASQAKTNEHIINICFERWWPYSFFDQHKQAQGIEVEIIKAALIDSDYKLVFHELPYRRCLAGVANNTFDFTLHVDKADGFATLNMSFTTWQLSLAVTRGRFASPDDFYQLAAPRVMISEDYNYPEQVINSLKAINAAIVERSFYEQTHEDGKIFFSVLNNNRVDAVLVDKVWALEMIKHHQLAVTFLPSPFHAEPQFMGYKSSNQTLADYVGAKLHRVTPEQIQTIRTQYLGN